MKVKLSNVRLEFSDLFEAIGNTIKQVVPPRIENKTRCNSQAH